MSTDDSGRGNFLIAQQAVLSQGGTVQSLSFYVAGASGQMRLGIYADANGNPGTLLAQTAAFTPVAGWNTQSILTPVFLPAGTYWLAHLAQSNSLHSRYGLSGTARGYTYSFGALPGTFSSTVQSAGIHYSMYATLIAGTPLQPDCTDPTSCNPVSAISSHWVCNTPGCTAPDWLGSVISWPSWSAYENNSRSGDQSRTVYSTDGQLLYPYMGAWVDGCQVSVVTGLAVIIEWERGQDVWRETFLNAGESYTIDLVSPEDGALIEGPSEGFSVLFSNCVPQNIYP